MDASHKRLVKYIHENEPLTLVILALQATNYDFVYLSGLLANYSEGSKQYQTISKLLQLATNKEATFSQKVNETALKITQDACLIVDD